MIIFIKLRFTDKYKYKIKLLINSWKELQIQLFNIEIFDLSKFLDNIIFTII